MELELNPVVSDTLTMGPSNQSNQQLSTERDPSMPLFERLKENAAARLGFLGVIFIFLGTAAAVAGGVASQLRNNTSESTGMPIILFVGFARKLCFQK